MYASSPALFPNMADISHILTFDEHAEVLLNDETCSFSSAARSDTDEAILILDLHNDGGNFGYTPRASTLAVFREACHWIRNRWEMRLLAHNPAEKTEYVVSQLSCLLPLL